MGTLPAVRAPDLMSFPQIHRQYDASLGKNRAGRADDDFKSLGKQLLPIALVVNLIDGKSKIALSGMDSFTAAIGRWPIRLRKPLSLRDTRLIIERRSMERLYMGRGYWPWANTPAHGAAWNVFTWGAAIGRWPIRLRTVRLCVTFY